MSGGRKKRDNQSQLVVLERDNQSQLVVLERDNQSQLVVLERDNQSQLVVLVMSPDLHITGTYLFNVAARANNVCHLSFESEC